MMSSLCVQLGIYFPQNQSCRYTPAFHLPFYLSTAILPFSAVILEINIVENETEQRCNQIPGAQTLA